MDSHATTLHATVHCAVDIQGVGVLWQRDASNVSVLDISEP